MNHFEIIGVVVCIANLAGLVLFAYLFLTKKKLEVRIVDREAERKVEKVPEGIIGRIRRRVTERY